MSGGAGRVTGAIKLLQPDESYVLIIDTHIKAQC